MKIRKYSLAWRGFAVSLFSLLALNLVSTHAFAAVRTWTGGGSDTNISTAANWSGNSAPVAGDSITFDASTTPAGKFTVNNDTTVNFAQITFQDTGLGTYDATKGFTLTGNAYKVSTLIIDTIANTPYPDLQADLTLTGNVTLMGPTNSSNYPFFDIFHNLTIGANTFTVDRNIFLTLEPTAVTSGTGLIKIAPVNGGVTINEARGLSGFQGSVELDAGSLFVNTSTSYSWSSVTLNGGNLVLENNNIDTTFAPALNVTNGSSLESFGGEAITGDNLSYFGCGSTQPKDHTITLSGAVTLASDLKVATSQDCGKYQTFKFTGAISGNFSIDQVSSSEGIINIAASSNTSKTPNGIYQPATTTTTVSSATNDSTPHSVFRNQTLVVDGVTGDIYVSYGGILEGSGTVGTADVQGTLAPGHSPGCINSNDLTLSGTYQWQNGGTTACTGYDQMKVTGTVNLTGSTLQASLYGGFTPAAGQSYTIIDNDGVDAVTGTFSGLAEGGTFTADGVTYSVTYKGGDGNDVVLTVKSVTAAAKPKAPDTGFSLLKNNPILALAVSSAAGLALISQGKKSSKRR